MVCIIKEKVVVSVLGGLFYGVLNVEKIEVKNNLKFSVFFLLLECLKVLIFM